MLTELVIPGILQSNFYLATSHFQRLSETLCLSETEIQLMLFITNDKCKQIRFSRSNLNQTDNLTVYTVVKMALTGIDHLESQALVTIP